jgi:hypothetical protein
MIYLSATCALMLGNSSFVEMDRTARQPWYRRLLGSLRDMVVSDSTVRRELARMDAQGVREDLYQTFLRWKERGGASYTLPSGRQIRLGAVDGTQWGNRFASCLQVIADQGDFLLDMELTKTHGNEREGTLKVTDRCAARLGDGCLDVIVGDGLYPCGPIFTGFRNHGFNAVVKMKAEERDRLLVTRRAWDRVLHKDPSVEIVTGIDHARGVLYRIEVIDEIKTDHYDDLLKVVHVIEEPIPNEECSDGESSRAPEPEKEFWVVSMDRSLCGLDIREIAHVRWTIETPGFKMLNNHVHSKRVWTRGEDGERAFEVLALLMFLAFNLIKAFRESLAADEIHRWVGRTVIPLAGVVSILIMTLCASTVSLVVN